MCIAGLFCYTRYFYYHVPNFLIGVLLFIIETYDILDIRFYYYLTNWSLYSHHYTMECFLLDLWKFSVYITGPLKVISLRNISKVFFTFLLYINGLCFTIHVIYFSCHFISINHINTYNQTTLSINIKYISMKIYSSTFQ